MLFTINHKSNYVFLYKSAERLKPINNFQKLNKKTVLQFHLLKCFNENKIRLSSQSKREIFSLKFECWFYNAY